jgi:acyl-CoA synthetase (AMP-forming)/AMP-acid ligase II
MSNLSDLLRSHAAAHPDRVAISFPRGKRRGAGWDDVRYGELDRQADAVAHGLRGAGLRPGDRAVLIVRPNRRFHALVFGMFRAGVVPVFIDPGMGLARALDCVRDIAPRGLIAVPPVHLLSFVHRAPFRSIEVRVTDGLRLGWGGGSLPQWLAAPSPAPASEPVRPEDDAVIVFTSGATGAPKGVALSHACMAARVRLIQQMLDLRAGEVIVETLLVYTILELCMGMTVAMPPMDLSKPATVDPDAVLDTVCQHRPQILSASPVVWQRLVRAERPTRLDGVRMLLTTAAPIPVDLHRRLRVLTDPGVELFTPYGATEAMPIAWIGSGTILSTTGEATEAGAGTCVGPLAPEADVRIIRATDDPISVWSDALELPVGELGEITVVTPGASEAYRNADAANARAKVRHGDRIRHRMGDVGYLDEAGRLWFCGRQSHLLHTAEGPLPNVPLEGVFNRHPAVYRSAVVGLGPAGAEEPVVVVELEPGQVWGDGLAAEVLALLRGTRWEGRVTRALVHPKLPTDPRHNSKVRNDLVKAWAEGQLTRR